MSESKAGIPQSTGRSCPLSDLAQRLETGFFFNRDAFGGALSDRRCPTSVAPPASGAIVRAFAGSHMVEIYDMLRTPGKNMPPTAKEGDMDAFLV